MNCNGKVTIQKKNLLPYSFIITFGLPRCFSAFKTFSLPDPTFGFFQVFLAVSLTDKHS